MKPFYRLSVAALCLLLLTGCLTLRKGGKETKDIPLSPSQMQHALSKARPPQQFGFTVYALDDGLAFGGRGRLHPNHFATVDMLEDDSPVIAMRGRAKRTDLNALIDPASPFSWIEFSAAQDFELFFMESNGNYFPYRGTYNTGGVPAFAGLITQMRIDNVFIENIPFFVRMARGSLGPLDRGIKEPAVDAVIGYDNLTAFEYVQFNLRDHTISFSATTPYTPIYQENPDAALIMKAPGHGLAVEGMIDGEPVSVLLDLAGDFSLARGDVKVSTTRSLEVGDLSFKDVETMLLPVHDVPPRIGRALLGSCLVTICNREGLVYFERLPEE